jgi:hypothetical protein
MAKPLPLTVTAAPLPAESIGSDWVRVSTPPGGATMLIVLSALPALMAKMAGCVECYSP